MNPPRRRVLIVDDVEDTVTSFAFLLSEMGHLVEYTTHPEAALVLARRFAPDLAFLDIGMPRIDGWQLAMIIRSEPALRAIRLVALTGYGAPEHRQRSMSLGFLAHLLKPVDIGSVERVLLAA